MTRLGPVLLVAGILCYMAGLWILHVNASPVSSIPPGDLMMSLLIGGTFVAVAGVVVWHRRRVHHRAS